MNDVQIVDEGPEAVSLEAISSTVSEPISAAVRSKEEGGVSRGCQLVTVAGPVQTERELLNRWFANEVLVHEAALVRYLRRVWRNSDEVHDLRQDIYVRVYEAARNARPASTKAFLFTTARNVVIDRVRRSRVVRIDVVGENGDLNVLVDEVTPERHVTAWQELRLLARAFRRLPAKGREVIWLRRVDELSQKQVAQCLGVSEKTVETHLRRSLQAMADALFSSKTWRRRQSRQRTRETLPGKGGS